MHPKAPTRSPADLRAEREHTLKDFIAQNLANAARGSPDCVILVARACDSVACHALIEAAGDLLRHGVGARIVLTAQPSLGIPAWPCELVTGFAHEVRLAADARVMDAHEQLVVGDRSVWFGDCMRRDPEKRDAFAQFQADDIEAARRARTTFGHLWQSARPHYRHSLAPSLVAAGAANDPLLAAALASDVKASLEAWQPVSRH